jgi:hypothetical protein
MIPLSIIFLLGIIIPSVMAQPPPEPDSDLTTTQLDNENEVKPEQFNSKHVEYKYTAD